MELKEPLSFEKQIEKLKSHGMVMEDEARVKEILAEINYYRFTGYTLQYRKNPDESDFVDINKKAHDLGISYGQYVALYMNNK